MRKKSLLDPIVKLTKLFHGKKALGLTWQDLLDQKIRKLYAGKINRPDDFVGYIGLHPQPCHENHISHDVTQIMPIPENSVDVYQSEDVFEHIEI